MKIAIIGAGNVGGSLGRGWARAGHDIAFGVRDTGDPKIKQLLGAVGTNGRACPVAEAADSQDIVVLATPWEATKDAVEAAGLTTDKIVIDATNALKADLSGLLELDTSAAEHVASWAPAARVVKAFNTIGAQHMASPQFSGQPASMFICGDDADAKGTVSTLAGDLGFEPVDAGPLSQARLLEALAMLWISMAYVYGHGADIAFKLLRK